MIYLSLHCHHQNDSCIKMGSDESHCNVSVGSEGQTVRDRIKRERERERVTYLADVASSYLDFTSNSSDCTLSSAATQTQPATVSQFRHQSDARTTCMLGFTCNTSQCARALSLPLDTEQCVVFIQKMN